jgi:hypothetical protein
MSGRVGGLLAGVRGVVTRAGRAAGLGIGVSSSLIVTGCVGVGFTLTGVGASRSAECKPRLRARNNTAATITIVFTDFMISPFKFLCINMDCLSTIIGR